MVNWQGRLMSFSKIGSEFMLLLETSGYVGVVYPKENDFEFHVVAGFGCD